MSFGCCSQLSGLIVAAAGPYFTADAWRRPPRNSCWVIIEAAAVSEIRCWGVAASVVD